MAQEEKKIPKYINFPIECLYNKKLKDGINEGINYAIGYEMRGYDCKDYPDESTYYQKMRYAIRAKIGVICHRGYTRYAETYQGYKRRGLTGCKTDLAYSVRNGLADGYPLWEMKFRAFLAFKSIIPTKGYIKTNKKMLCARMAGILNPSEIDNLGSFYYKVLSNRRTWQGFIKSMCEEWGLGYYPKGRGFYVAFGISGKTIKERLNNKEIRLKEAMGKS